MKSNMRRLSTILLLLVLYTGLRAESQKIRIVATTTFLADMVKNIAGDHAEVVSLMPIGGDPHIYEPIPEDADKISKANIIFKNGLTLEGWLDEMIRFSGTKGIIITVSDGIKPITNEAHAGASDPHAWMSIPNAIIYIENIKNTLVSADPKHTDSYESNYKRYKNILVDLDKEIRENVSKIPPENRVIITSHDAFRYFGNEYGFSVESVLGTSTDSDVRIEDIKHLTHILDTKNIPTIFVESTINPKLMQQIASDRGIKIGGKLFADSLGDLESGADTYVGMIRHNMGVITKGLTAVLNNTQEDEKDYLFISLILGIFATTYGFVSYRLNQSGKSVGEWGNFSLEINNLTVSYDKKPVFHQASLVLNSGYVYGLIGGNGSGKSTLVKTICGLIPQYSGKITLNGENPDNLRKYIAYIPQKEEIDWGFPATVFDIVMMGRYPYRRVFERFTDEDRKKAMEMLEKMGIAALKHKQIGTLSGGQQQRVFIARALCQEAEVYIMDEPFVGVDIVTEEKIMSIVKSLAEAGKMVVIIHHDLGKVPQYFDKLVMINRGIIASGDTKEVFTRENIQKTYGGNLVFGDLYV